MTGVDDEHPRPTEDEINGAFRALGRYMYEFSRLMWHMRTTTSSAIGQGFIGGLSLGEIALSEANPYQITNAFFGVSRFLSRFDEVEEKVSSILRNAVLVNIELRNRVAHGDWMIGFTFLNVPGKLSDRPTSPRLTKNRPLQKGPAESRIYGPEEMDAFSDDIIDLRHLVTEFGHVATHATNNPVLKTLRVRDVFTIAGTKRKPIVERGGPKAPNPPMTYL